MPYAKTEISKDGNQINATMNDGSYVSITLLTDGGIRIRGNADSLYFDDLEERFTKAYSENKGLSIPEIVQAIKRSWDEAEV